MNDQKKPELTLAQIRQIMRSEDVPTGQLFANTHTMNNPEEKQLLATVTPAQLMQISTDVAAVCGEIVKKTAIQIKGRRYIKVEGWQALATAHGCVAGSRDVERVASGYRAIGELRRMTDGALLGTAEGFVGEDEVVWFGGKDQGGKTWARRHDYAIRAMAQTRAISRVCRSAFAHCVVLIDADLSTTPAEEADSIMTSSPKKPVGYDQEDLVNCELQEAADRKRRVTPAHQHEGRSLLSGS
jgi:hypothetical protein